ncbi:MAG: TIGR00341 family protein [Candidatus Nanohaloarchaeota archaeon QJJ-5]|nr:TIGR00341 family protein [Candidatus Nanohaloarchaeota archaeon QJJ-5]
MKNIEVEVPADGADLVEEVLKEYSDDISKQEIEKDDNKYIEFNLTIDSPDIDALSEDLKGITDLDRGELTVRVLKQSAIIEKGKEAQGGSETLSVQEMYSKAISFATFTKASWMLIALASSIAAFGMILNNVIIVIGAMMIAPMLSPLIASSFGLVIGDRTLIQKSILYSAFSILFSILISFLITLPLPISANELMYMVSDPGLLPIALSLFVGAATSLTFMTEARETLAGVAVAIALVPPSAVAGMSLGMVDLDLFLNVMIVLVTNVISIILAGSLTFKFMGVAPSTYYRKKVSEEKLRTAVMVSVTSLLIISTPLAIVSYHNYQNVGVQNTVNNQITTHISGPIISKDIQIQRNTISIEIVAINASEEQNALKDSLDSSLDHDIALNVISVPANVTSYE